MKKQNESNRRPRHRMARTPEERDNQMINLAIDKVEERMLAGKASSQEYVHYLRLAATRETAQLEKDKLALELELVKAKTDALKASSTNDALCRRVISALGEYRGEQIDEDL